LKNGNHVTLQNYGLPMKNTRINHYSTQSILVG